VLRERDVILTRLLRFAAAAGLIAYLPGVIAGIAESLWGIVMVDTLAYAAIVAAAFVPNFSFNAKLGILVGASLLVAAVVLVGTGPLGAGYIWFIVAVVLSALFGRRGIVTLTISLSMAIMAAWAFAVMLGVDGHGATPMTIGVIAASLFFASLALAIVTRRLLDVMVSAISTRELLAERLADELRKSNEVREELERSLSTKETLLRELQHRVRNNLQVVQGLLASDGDADEKADRCLEKARRRLNALTIVNDIFLSNPDARDVDVFELMRSVAAITGEEGVPCRVETDRTTLATIETQSAVIVAVIASDIISALSELGPTSIRVDGLGRGLRICFHCGLSVDPGRISGILDGIASGRVARNSVPDIVLGMLAPDDDRAPGIFLEYRDVPP